MNFLVNNENKKIKHLHIKNKKMDESKKNIITFSTCWYIIKSKFDEKTYINWIQNLLLIVNNFNLVIYTNNESFKLLKKIINFSNKKIKIIIKPFEDFYMYKYKDFWIKNHENSNLNLHKITDWKLNMLWNEKIFFVNETIKNKYFDTQHYGWCDIGYFRNRINDLHTKNLLKWPNDTKLSDDLFNDNNIHYGCVQNNTITYVKLMNEIKTHYIEKRLNQPTVQFEEKCFAGGFFILKSDLIDNYIKVYDEKIMYYFMNNYIVKDDQIILMDIIFTNPNMFYIHTEDNPKFDNWFMFQRLLL